MADLYAMLRARTLERLRIGVGDNEIHAFQIGVDHVVHRIAAGAAHAENKNAGLQLGGLGNRKIQCHRAGSVKRARGLIPVNPHF